MEQQQVVPEISLDEFKEWSNSPVTKFIFNELSRRKVEMSERVRGYVRYGEYHQAAILEGQLIGLDVLLNIDYEDVLDEV